jgi:sugar (pentulose or hexulose) kinase
MNMSGLVAGVDCSTQSTKVVVVESDSGAIVGTGRAQHTVTGTGGARETHPDVWWEALRQVLIGGGAGSKTWWNVVQRLSGLPILIPKLTDLVAVGAAVQAAAILHSQDPRAVAAHWKTTVGTQMDPIPRDIETIARHTSVRLTALSALDTRRAGGMVA